MSSLFWSDSHDRAAKAEGWSIFDCCGSTYGKWQICKVDEPEDGQPVLDDDEDAWRIVITGLAPHHLVARTFLRERAPKEWQSICHHTAKHVDARTVAPELLAEVIAAYLLPDPYEE